MDLFDQDYRKTFVFAVFVHFFEPVRVISGLRWLYGGFVRKGYVTILVADFDHNSLSTFSTENF